MIYLHPTSFQKESDMVYRGTFQYRVSILCASEYLGSLLNNVCNLIPPNLRQQDLSVLKGTCIWICILNMPSDDSYVLKLRTAGVTRPKNLSQLRDSHHDHHFKHMWLNVFLLWQDSALQQEMWLAIFSLAN